MEGGKEGCGKARRAQKRSKVGLNVITDRGDKKSNYQ